jgi:ubiquitin C-terminal hydrolase
MEDENMDEKEFMNCVRDYVAKKQEIAKMKDDNPIFRKINSENRKLEPMSKSIREYMLTFDKNICHVDDTVVTFSIASRLIGDEIVKSINDQLEGTSNEEYRANIIAKKDELLALLISVLNERQTMEVFGDYLTSDDVFSERFIRKIPDKLHIM